MVAVSVVMAAYNDASRLRETLDSVLIQEMGDFELIVVNDGSSDQCVGEILTEFQEKDRRIQVISKKNEGLTRALLDGCSQAKGRYIARIDAGDAMHSDRLEKQMLVLEQNPSCAFVSCWTGFYGPVWEPMWLAKGRPDSDCPVSVLPDDPEMGLAGDIPHHGSVMFRKSAYERAGGYRPDFYYGQDWDLWHRLAEIGKFHIVQNELYRARFFADSISMTRKQQQDEVARCSKRAFVERRRGKDESEWLVKAALQRPLQNKQTGEEKIKNVEPGLYFIGEALRRRRDTRCRRYLVEAIRHAPLKPRAYVRWIQSFAFPGGNSP